MRITLCGSTRFKDEFERLNRKLSLMGHVVYSVACFGHSGDDLTEAQKATLDKVHMAKIDNSDAIVVINVGGYIGHSTLCEVAYANLSNKCILFLECGWPPELAPYGRKMCHFPGCNNDMLTGPCALCYE